MKTFMQILLVMLMAHTLEFLYGQDLKGQWNGTLDVQGTQFRIVFHVNKTDTLYTATLDSPDQKAYGIPVTLTNFNYPDVKFEISTIGLIYEGILSENRIAGKWMQAGQSFSLLLLKAEIQSD